jgi:hypothetical protein
MALLDEQSVGVEKVGAFDPPGRISVPEWQGGGSRSDRDAVAVER